MISLIREIDDNFAIVHFQSILNVSFESSYFHCSVIRTCQIFCILQAMPS